MGRVDEDIVWEKGDGRIVDKQAVRHLFCFSFILRHEKPLDVGRLMKRVRVSLDHLELFH